MDMLSSGSSEPVKLQSDGEDVDDVDNASKEAMLRLDIPMPFITACNKRAGCVEHDRIGWDQTA
jgi:hypothetical protein